MACDIYGREEVKFTLELTDTNNSLIENTVDWTINDTLLDTSDNTTSIIDTASTTEPTKVFESAGTKTVSTILDFDDGWGNTYNHITNLVVVPKVYLPPVLDFSWTPLEPTTQEVVTFTQAHDDIRDMAILKAYGRIDEVRVDYYDDGSYEEDFILDSDTFTNTFTVKQDNIPIRLQATYWDGWEHQTNELSKTMNMSNIPPISSYTRTDDGVCIPSYLWTATSTDVDDDNALLTYLWQLYSVDGTDTLIDSATTKNYTYPFQFEGDYKIKLTTTDTEGLTNLKEELFTVAFDACTGTGGTGGTLCADSGTIKIQRGVWQMIAIPMPGTLQDDFLTALETQTGQVASDLIEVCSAYRGDLDRFLSYVPGFTLPTSEHNFSLTYNDAGSLEIVAMWIKAKPWTHTTDDIIYSWSLT